MNLPRLAILDPSAGISGDMLLGALVAAGAGEEWLADLPRRLGVEATVTTRKVLRGGVACTKVDVVLPGGVSETPAEEVEPEHHHAHDHSHEHHHHGAHAHEHHHHGPHRHVGELIRQVEQADLSGSVRDRAIAAFRLLAEAEGQVHGMAWDQVHLHEVGAVDALVDIVGVIEGFERLGITRVATRPVTVGSGWVRAAHGTIAVPAPATLRLLQGLEIGPNGPVTGEATTPTGAVLLRVLVTESVPARWRALGEGWGAGGRDPHGYPNALRLILAEPVREAGEVVVLQADIDDLAPEYLEPLREAVMAAGALDVQTWTTQMKKGRVGFRVELVCEPGRVEGVSQALFRHSTTAGIRRQVAERITLPRKELQVPGTEGAIIRVKVLSAPDGPRFKPEYDDIAAAARQTGRPAHELAREAAERARGQLEGGAEGASGTPNQESR